MDTAVATNSATKEKKTKANGDTKGDTPVRPKRQYIKKKDRLQGIKISTEPVVIRFD
jgi:hypothetical protein